MGVYGRAALLPSKQEYISTYAGVPLEETASLGNEMKSRFMGNMEAMAGTVEGLNAMYETVDEKDRGYIENYSKEAREMMENIASNENAWEKATMPIVNFAMGIAGDDKLKEQQLIKTKIDGQQAKYDKMFESGALDQTRYEWHSKQLANSYQGMEASGDDWRKARGSVYEGQPANFFDLTALVESSAKNFPTDTNISRNADGTARTYEIAPGVNILESTTGINREQAFRYMNAQVQNDPNARAYYSEEFMIANNGKAPTNEELAGYMSNKVRQSVDKIAHQKQDFKIFNTPTAKSGGTKKDKKKDIEEAYNYPNSVQIEIDNVESMQEIYDEQTANSKTLVNVNSDLNVTKGNIAELNANKAAIPDSNLTEEEKAVSIAAYDVEIAREEENLAGNQNDLAVMQNRILRSQRLVGSAKEVALQVVGDFDATKYSALDEDPFREGSPAVMSVAGGIGYQRTNRDSEAQNKFARASYDKELEDMTLKIINERKKLSADATTWGLNDAELKEINRGVFGEHGVEDAQHGSLTVKFNEDSLKKVGGGVFFKMGPDEKMVQYDASDLDGMTGMITGVTVNPQSFNTDGKSPKGMLAVTIMEPGKNKTAKLHDVLYIEAPQNMIRNKAADGSISELTVNVTDWLMKGDRLEDYATGSVSNEDVFFYPPVPETSVDANHSFPGGLSGAYTEDGKSKAYSVHLSRSTIYPEGEAAYITALGNDQDASKLIGQDYHIVYQGYEYDPVSKRWNITVSNANEPAYAGTQDALTQELKKIYDAHGQDY